MKKIYTIKEENGKLLVQAPYSKHMNDFYQTIGARWKSPYRIVERRYYDSIINELTYYFGDADDLPVDLQIDVNSLNVRDRLVIAGVVCIEVCSLNKTYELSSNTHISNNSSYNNWIKSSSVRRDSNYFFTKKIYAFFNPFKIKNCTLFIRNISRTRAQDFINSNPKWTKKILIIPANNEKYFEIKQNIFDKCLSNT